MIGMLRRREMMARDAYQFVEYIQNDGQCYIQTPYLASIDYVCRVKVEYLSYGFAPFGTRIALNNNAFYLYLTNGGDYAFYYGSHKIFITRYLNIPLKYEISSTSIFDVTNNRTYTLGDYTLSNPYPISLMNMNTGGAQGVSAGAGRLYYFSIDGVCDLRPAIRVNDNEVGVYDVLNHIFYTNTGTGKLIAGPNI